VQTRSDIGKARAIGNIHRIAAELGSGLHRARGRWMLSDFECAIPCNRLGIRLCSRVSFDEKSRHSGVSDHLNRSPIDMGNMAQPQFQYCFI
jgi:hypothetical protein